MYVNYPEYSVRDILIDNNNWERYKLFHKGELREEQIKRLMQCFCAMTLGKDFGFIIAMIAMRILSGIKAAIVGLVVGVAGSI